MTRQEAVAGLEMLSRNFTQPPLSEPQAELYIERLRDLTLAEWTRAVAVALDTLERPFFPQIATLRRLAGRLLTWGEVYERVVMLLRQWPVSPPPSSKLHPFDAFVIRRLGGWQRLTNGEDDTWIRRDIERDCESWQQDAVKQGVAIPLAREAITAAPKGGYAAIGEMVIPLHGPVQIEGPQTDSAAPTKRLADLTKNVGKPQHSRDWRPTRPTARPPAMTDEQIAARKAALREQAKFLQPEDAA